MTQANGGSRKSGRPLRSGDRGMTPSERLIRRLYTGEAAERRIRDLHDRHRCVDCEVDTSAIGEYYMVKDEVWGQAWGAGRRKSWRELFGPDILCIGCLEQQLGRTLTPRDFTDAPINKDRDSMSARLRDRLRNRTLFPVPAWRGN